MKVIAIMRTGKMLKIGTNENDATWYFLADPVVNFVKDNISNGDEVTIKYDRSGGKSTITYITKGKGESQQTTPKESPPQGVQPELKFVCEECGKPLKDDRYKKCYTCNQKNPAKVAVTSKDELIKREAVAHATSRVMIGLQGHIEPKNVKDIFTEVYNTILGLVENK